MTYEQYLQTMVERHYTSFEQFHCDAIAEALIAIGFEREEAYQRAIDATAVTYIVRVERSEVNADTERKRQPNAAKRPSKRIS